MWRPPSTARARHRRRPDRLALLAGRHASIITADWHALTQVLSTVVPRAAG